MEMVGTHIESDSVFWNVITCSMTLSVSGFPRTLPISDSKTYAVDEPGSRPNIAPGKSDRDMSSFACAKGSQ
jgi:hypothetical protein